LKKIKKTAGRRKNRFSCPPGGKSRRGSRQTDLRARSVEVFAYGCEIKNEEFPRGNGDGCENFTE